MSGITRIDDAGIDEKLTKAERKGKNAGITILFETMQRLKNGETVEKLRKSGWDEKTLDVALAALRLKNRQIIWYESLLQCLAIA